MMRTLKEYISECETWIDTPAVGDSFAINIREECLIESHIVETTADGVVLQADDRMIQLMEQYGITLETVRRYGAVGSSRGQGYTLEEESIDECGSEPAPQHDAGSAFDAVLDLIRSRAGLESRMSENANDNDPLAAKAADDAAVNAMDNPNQATTVDEGRMSDIDIDLRSLANRGDEEDLIAALEGDLGPGTADVLQHMMEELKDELASKGMNDVINDYDRMIEILWDKLVEEYGGDPDFEEMSEAEYQGRKVQLGKPMQGDVKKFKVYVKDPKTGNVKKVNFGDKTMRIKKSNPARRRSFRARHNCDNPGPRTKARYWSCRKW
jgi:hypothetical protein